LKQIRPLPLKLLELAGLRNFRSADERMDDFRLGLPLDPDHINLDQREIHCDSLCGIRSDDDRYFVCRGLSLQARRKIDGVAHGRVLETQFRSHIADDALAGVDAYSDPDRHKTNTGFL